MKETLKKRPKEKIDRFIEALSRFIKAETEETSHEYIGDIYAREELEKAIDDLFTKEVK